MVDDLLGIAPCGLESLALNTFINVQIEMKKLRFHTPGLDGKTKCHKIHIGSKSEFCPTLLAHGTAIPADKSDTYLGDVISGDGTNRLNIESRVNKGIGKVAQIMSMIGKISLGKHYFKIAFLLRESIFLSAVLTNSEVWYKLTKSELEELEILDRSLIKRILAVPNSTPTAALYLETGCMSIGTIIKARRLNFLQYLLKLPTEDMLARVFHCQWLESNQFDWTEQVRVDLADFKLPCDLELIKKKSVFSWKNLVKKKAKEYEFSSMVNLKETKSESKMRKLNYEKLQAQDYLSKYEVKKAQTIFKFRVRMEKFSGNFKGRGPLELCPLCSSHYDLQELSLKCPVVIEKVNPTGDYEDIFKPNIPENVVEDIQEIIKIRNNQE